MARDYGHRRPARRSSQPNTFLVMVVTFVLGYATASFMDIEKLSQWVNSQLVAQNLEKQAVSKPTKTAQLPPKPKFEFYTLLTNDKVPSQSNTAAKTATVATAPGSQNTPATLAAKAVARQSQASAVVEVAEGRPLPATPAGKGAYLVQVASFKSRKDAEHMKGLLTLKGFDVQVVAVTQAKGNWFRVVVGPYANKSLAQQAQLHLANTERLKGMITAL